MTAGKSKVVAELGETTLLLPDALNRALSANNRAKYLMTLLQTAQSHAENPETPAGDLRQERLACDVAESELDKVVEESRRDPSGGYRIPRLEMLVELLASSVREMLVPLRLAFGQAREKRAGSDHERRLSDVLATVSGIDGRIDRDQIERLVSGDRSGRDSLHLLVMDLHKELNRIQQEIAGESIDGAHVYAIADSDRPAIKAFMSGLNHTRELKFDHPGLDTTCTRAGERLVIQNDLGETDAHVLVVQVEGLKITLTHTDVHLPRVLFFQSLFAPFAMSWEDTRSKRAEKLDEQVYHLCVGNYAARDPADLEDYLRFLGSRLVFLIDWNRARKRLRKLAPKRVCLEVLKWAAENQTGHRGFLQLGGDQLIVEALQQSKQVKMAVGWQLSDILGPEKIGAFLKFALKAASDGLRQRASESLIRDEIAAELRHYIGTIHQDIMEIAGEHCWSRAWRRSRKPPD